MENTGIFSAEWNATSNGCGLLHLLARLKLARSKCNAKAVWNEKTIINAEFTPIQEVRVKNDGSVLLAMPTSSR
jgi:hypothetical protein